MARIIDPLELLLATCVSTPNHFVLLGLAVRKGQAQPVKHWKAFRRRFSQFCSIFFEGAVLDIEQIGAQRNATSCLRTFITGFLSPN